jgi:hypothetical protein
MSNTLTRAERYRDLAEECRCLAAATFSTRMRSRSSWMAETCTTLAEAEETRSTGLRRLAAPVSSLRCYGRKLSAIGRPLAHAAHR